MPGPVVGGGDFDHVGAGEPDPEEVDIEGEEDGALPDPLPNRRGEVVSSESATLIRWNHSEAEDFGHGKIVG